MSKTNKSLIIVYLESGQPIYLNLEIGEECDKVRQILAEIILQNKRTSLTSVNADGISVLLRGRSIIGCSYYPKAPPMLQADDIELKQLQKEALKKISKMGDDIQHGEDWKNQG